MGFGALGACGKATSSEAMTVVPLLGGGSRPLGPIATTHSRIAR
jgi:hypothetical protein